MIKSILAKTLLTFSLVFLATSLQLKSQTNNSTPYCQGFFATSPCNQPGLSNVPTNTVNNFIDNVLTAGATSNIVNANSGCNGLSNNYIYYCTPFLVGSLGQVITMSVQSGQLFPQSFAIFVDWNQNNNFEIPAEQLAGTLNTVPTNSFFVTTFTVPPTQQVGLYRLRVRSYATSNAYVDPCNMAPVGETEDYNFYVGNSGPPLFNAVINYNSPLCSGQNLNFSLNHNGSGGTSFSWSGPNGFSSFLQNPSIANITPSVVGTYTVNITDGSCSAVKTIQVGLTPTPTISINSATVCAGTQVTLVATGATTYTWSSGQTTPTIYITPIATATFVATGTTNSCTASNSTTVTVAPTFTMDVSSTASLICKGSSVTLNANGASNYTWTTGANTNSIVVSPTISTSYTVFGVTGPCTNQAVYMQAVEDCSGISFISKNDNVLVYPNPFSNELHIQAADNSRMQIYSALGELIMDKNIRNGEKINTSALHSGIYFISIGDGGRNKVTKIIKN